ncbi:MAG: hypothetical protein AAF997_20300 [Myxococcota bacterium]
MKRIVVAVLVAAWPWTIWASAEAPAVEPRYAEPRATATLQTPAPVWVDQMAELEVVLFRDDAKPDKAPPDFGEVRVPNAIALRTDYAPPPEVLSVDGTAMLMQKRRYLVFPQAAGSVDVPPIEVSWAAADGSPTRVRTEPVSFEARLPSGAGAEPYVVASAVSVREAYDGDVDRLRVGDSFTRTVIVEATGTDAMMIPLVELGNPTHLAAYPSQPDLRTTVVRGRYDARRSDATTFVAESFGWTKLPEVNLRWLNPQTGEWRTETLPERSLRVRINPSLGFTALGGADSNARRLGVLAALVLVGWFFVVWWKRRGRAEPPSRAPSGPSERALFLRVLKAAYRDDPIHTLNATYAWMGSRDDAPATLHALCDPSPDAGQEADALQRSLFRKPRPTLSPWRGRAFASAMRRLRRTRTAKRPSDDLPPINPGRSSRCRAPGRSTARS